ncbi:MAG: glycosyltransferase family 9 protein [Ignavibacteriales bacterium]|nr:MAG: glycosyltransferase family 9 protein [Ignavibacteriales bacterium]
MKINPSEINKILCIKPRGIGDIVLSTIILDNLIAHFPNAKIDYLTEHFAKHSVTNNPLVNKVLTMHKTEFVLKVAWRIRKEKYDMLIDLWSNPRSAQITFFSGVKYRIGYAYRGRKYAYNILGTSGKGDHHSAEHNLELLKPLGVNIISKKLHYYVGNLEKVFADKFFNDNNLDGEKVFGIIPAGGWDSKRCDKEKWVDICTESVNKFNCKILVLWGPGDESDAQFIKSKLGENCLLAPKSSLPQMAAMISECDLVIANDSGPMHIAAALGVKTLGIFGPTNPKAHGPYSQNSDYVIKDDLDCIICNKLICPFQHECMRELSTDTVIKKVSSLINR